MSLLYLGLLLVSIGCMALIDRRFRLFVWHAPTRAIWTLAAGVAFLLAWDVSGIAAGVFLHTPNAISTGVMLAPHLPLEEVVFLVFLTYLSMVLYEGALSFLAARAARGERAPTHDRSGADA